MCEHGDTVIVMVGFKTCGIDRCIAPLVRALNAWGIRTVASCCGHNKRPGSIILEDGRELIIAPDWPTARRVDKAFPAIDGRMAEGVISDEEWAAFQEWRKERAKG